MAVDPLRSRRLFVGAELAPGRTVELDRGQANYLLSVLRLAEGAEILVFNGRDGEWRARLELSGRKAGRLIVAQSVRAQPKRPAVTLLFAPLKHARLDYMVQKATEMGAGTLRPVLTRRTVASRVNQDRMRANIVEAAEQCGILAVPDLLPELDLPSALKALEPGTFIVFCDEDAASRNPLAALSEAAGSAAAVAIGPEGGFDAAERELILARPNVCRISLGPRILRADTAAVAALALVQAARGEW